MNFSTLFGFALAAVVFLHSVLTSTDNREIFMTEHAIIIVVGGTMAAGSICFPIKKILTLGWIAIKKMFFGSKVDYPEIIRSIIDLGEKSRNDAAFLKNEIPKIGNPFLADAMQLITEGLNEDQMVEILSLRIQTHSKRYTAEANIFKTLAKFPPAFGLLGTTLGMIALLQKLGGEDASKQIGPAMAIGLVATLYGIAMTNLIFIPISENLIESNREDTIMRKIVMEGALMIKAKMHPIMIEQKLNSYLLPNERVSFKAGSVAKTAKKAA